MLRLVSAVFVFAAAISGLGAFWFGIVLPLYDQAAAWLKTGNVPARDLIWAQSQKVCEATGGLDVGRAGMELCRRSDYYLDGWIGVTQILNWLGHQHIIFFSVVYVAVSVWAVRLFLDS